MEKIGTLEESATYFMNENTQLKNSAKLEKVEFAYTSIQTDVCATAQVGLMTGVICGSDSDTDMCTQTKNKNVTEIGVIAVVIL